MPSHTPRRRIKAALQNGEIYFTYHALLRLKERGSTIMDVEYALSNGFHDQQYDTVGSNGHWRYRIQGKTIDGDLIRIVVEVEEKIIVITVIK